MRIWWRVEADYGQGWVLEGEADTVVSRSMLIRRAFAANAKAIRVYMCEDA